MARHTRLSALLVALLLVRPAAAGNDYYFGDSDLEQGNYQIIAGKGPGDHAPYYCRKGLCRDSNGPMWAELVTPGLRAALATPVPAGSLNFAVSGAHMTRRGDDELPYATGVSWQVERFTALQDAGAIRVGEHDRFFIHAGSNDLMRILEGEAPALVQRDIVSAATQHVETLSKRGARTIVLAQVQPVQYLPLLAGPEYAELRKFARQFVTETNRKLAASLAMAQTRLPNSRIVLIDQGAFLEHLRRNYSRLGFTVFHKPCYDAQANTLCAKDAEKQNRYVFFDSNHFSAAGHALLADWYQSALCAATEEAQCAH